MKRKDAIKKAQALTRAAGQRFAAYRHRQSGERIVCRAGHAVRDAWRRLGR